MPLILVVDRDERVPARVREALGGEGWTVAHVKDVTAAMQSVASEAPDLFLVAADLPTAEQVLSSFARRQGGPGTIALAADGPPPEGGQDLVLPRAFTDGDLRSAVDRILKTGDRPARPQADEPKLTSHDIFGDLVAEVEREARDGRKGAAAKPPPPPARPTAAPGRPPSASRSIDDDLERKLEQTLSGVLGPASKRPVPRPPSPPAAGSATPPRAPGGPPPAARRPSDDVDKLISDTLSGLEKPAAPKRRPAKDDPFDLSELEAMLDRPRKPRPAAPAAPPPATPVQPAGGPGPKPPAPEPPGPPPVPPPSLQIPPKPEEVPFGSLFADEMREVPDDALEEAAQEKAAAAAGGRDFGQYRLLDRIGVGGMAEVWKARMTGVEGFQKTVAIKRILPHLTDSTDFVEMFIDEAKLAAQLNHANIIHIYDLGKLGDDYYIAMEHVEGENLRSILNRTRERGVQVPEGVALHVAARLAGALDYAHRKRDFDDRELGLVHRDVSPQNVLVGYEGTIKLCDFGIVKAVSKSSHTQMGALKGKLQYMSPEQAYGKPVDGRSDIFAVGALLFEMLTGRRLFVGESEMEVLEAVRECRVVPPGELAPSVRPEVDAVVLKALAREPEARFQSAGELMRQLEEIVASLRPAPGQRELAVFMARLFDREVEDLDEAVPEPVPPAAPAAPVPAQGPAKEPAQAPPAAAEDASLPVSAATVPISAAEREAALAGAHGQPVQSAQPVQAVQPVPPAPPKEPTKPAAPPRDGGSDPIGPWLDEPAAEGAPAPVEAVAPVGPAIEPEEGGRRGKGLLVAAILLVLIGGAALAWYLVQRRAGTGAPEVVPVESERAVAPETAEPDLPAAATGGEAADAMDTAGAGEAADAPVGEAAGEGADPEAADAPLEDDDITEMIDQKVEEELARREEILRRQFEEEERRIQRQLQALEETQRQEAEAAEAEPAEPPPPQG